MQLGGFVAEGTSDLEGECPRFTVLTFGGWTSRAVQLANVVFVVLFPLVVVDFDSSTELVSVAE
jgi:hypothetical protein